MNARADPAALAGYEDRAALVAAEIVRRADERAAFVGSHPLPDQGALFPNLNAVRAEFYIQQIREMVYATRDGCAGLYWWNEQMTQRDRRFLCRVAGADVALASRAWLELTPSERALMLAKFHWLAEWVKSFHAPLSAYRPLAFGAGA